MAYIDPETGELIQDDQDIYAPPTTGAPAGDPYHDPRNYAGYDPYHDPGNYAPNPSPTPEGGYSTPPPIDLTPGDNYGKYPKGWEQGPDGLWYFRPQSTLPPPTTTVPPPRPPRLPPPPNNGGGYRIPGTTDYPIAGGKTFFTYPDWVPPEEHFATFTPKKVDVKPFEYPDFVGPTAETFQADPGYGFRASQMDEAIKNAKSATGLLSSGGTLADLMSMRGGLASQEFGNVWNRGYQGWQANRGNAMDKWKSAYQTESDAAQRELTNYLTQEQAKAQDWERSRTLYGTNLGKEASTYGLNLDTSQLNLARDNAGFGNLLSLFNIMTRTLPTYTPAV